MSGFLYKIDFLSAIKTTGCLAAATAFDFTPYFTYNSPLVIISNSIVTLVDITTGYGLSTYTLATSTLLSTFEALKSK